VGRVHFQGTLDSPDAESLCRKTFLFAELVHLFLANARACNKPYEKHALLPLFCGGHKMSSASDGEIELDEETYKLAEKCAKKTGLTIDEFISSAIDEKCEKLRRAKK
jgi:hypothetical protein